MPAAIRSAASRRRTANRTRLPRPPTRAMGSGRLRIADTILSTLTRQAETATTTNVRRTPSVAATTTLRIWRPWRRATPHTPPARAMVPPPPRQKLEEEEDQDPPRRSRERAEGNQE